MYHSKVPLSNLQQSHFPADAGGANDKTIHERK